MQDKRASRRAGDLPYFDSAAQTPTYMTPEEASRELRLAHGSENRPGVLDNYPDSPNPGFANRMAAVAHDRAVAELRSAQLASMAYGVLDVALTGLDWAMTASDIADGASLAAGLPGAGFKISKQGVKLALRQARKAVRKGFDDAIHAGRTAAERLKTGPKSWPDGAHNDTIKRRIGELERDGHIHIAGGSKTEEVILTPGGCKGCRRPDITTRAPNGSIHRENVGLTTSSGSPVPRETDALNDIQAATGQRPAFTPYNKAGD